MIKDLNKLRNIGISAHIDSGKTTLSERILFYTGKIHKIQEVRGKEGDGAKMDHMELEKEKGITIQSAATYATWGDNPINIIDTPGHVDFTIEVERALRVLDGGILVLCSVSGVQSQSITVDRQLRRYSVPNIAFINKCDRAGANPFNVIDELREELKHNAVALQIPIGLEDRFEGVVDLLNRQAIYFDGEHGEKIRKEDCPEELVDEMEKRREELVEALADLDDELAMYYLEGEEVSAEVMEPVIRRETLARNLTPVFMGTALKNKGVQPLLDAVVKFLPSPLEMEYEALNREDEDEVVELEPDPEKPLVMLAFKLEDGRYGQLTYCRIYQGTLEKGDDIYNMSSDQKHKVGRLVRMHSDEMHEIEKAEAGDIVALFGIDCASGDTFTDGDVDVTMTSMFVPEPVITFAVAPKSTKDYQPFSKALNRFAKEDPTFQVSRDEESGQTIIGGMGELHLQVYIERIRREYGAEIEVGEPQVAYRETITAHTDFDHTLKKQTGGSGQYARVVGYLEPLTLEEAEEADDGGDKVEGYEFVNEIRGGVIPRDFQPACDKGFQDAMVEGGLIGFPVVNVRACINDGDHHSVDSSDMAFRTASRQAFNKAYMKANPVILEPIMKVEVESPEEFSGSVLGGLNRRRGMITGSKTRHGFAIITAEVPLSEMFGYSSSLRSATQGKAEFSMEFEKYSPVPAQIQQELIEEKRREEANS